MRAQANLPALAVALLVVSTTTGLAVVIADGAFASAQRDAAERATATAIADRLTAPDSPTTERRNVLNRSRLTAAVLADVVPAGITGAHDVALSRYETTTLHFEGDADAGEVEVTYYPRQTTKGRLEVTVDA